MIFKRERDLHLFLWATVALLMVWSGWAPKDRWTWWMEVLPVFIGTAILLKLYSRFTFSRLVCWWMWIHAIVLMIGGHYTYAEVPLFNWIRDTFELSRNHYDRVGHFLQGFVPALIAREVFIRLRIVKRGAWLGFVVVCVSLAISAMYELVEWQAAVWTGTKADAFLGTQGDVWDTQKDMALAFVGALSALAFLSKRHDRSIQAKETVPHADSV